MVHSPQELPRRREGMSIPVCYPQTQPKAILFDWDNTLVDTYRTSFRGLNEVLQHFKKPPLVWESFVTEPALSERGFFQKLFPTPEEFSEASTLFRQLMAQHRLQKDALFPGVPELITWIHNQGIPSGVVSNKNGDVLRTEIQHLGLAPYFRCAVGSYDTPEDKPHPLPLLHALTQIPMEAGHHVWFVGDSIVDVLCAQKADCVPVTVRFQVPPPCPVIQTRDCLHVHELLKSLV